ncbi:tetratricopeptide repeat protein [Saccharopolyspora phatthalungensis]|uniref:Tetratricopeptide (TPR) repeat protein n=1 Tax=Saccharopolyspora phatthalungensis TaxID=664693 RepID=A0A840Q5G5_9PSEU|nr:tetratricopeptide repeat protein [Saccharopolyspora phatthalungensis]MBB5155844.1 tetratricopeptide (TPR) repeat protein [Saccharopolyspora phatthalungensis]
MDGWHNANNAAVDGNVIQAGRIERLVMNVGGQAEPPKPDMLRINPEHLGFANRTAELAELDRLWRDAERAGKPLVVALSGMMGIGKSLTALRWAHRVREQFPGGIFVGDLRGSDPDGARTPGEVLGTFLGRLGLAGAALPPTEEERSAAFREITAHRRILLILDDAATAAQVLALLPSSPTSAVLVTSRRELTFLGGGVRPMRVEPFEEEAAIALLADSLGDSDSMGEGADSMGEGAEAEEAALRKLSEACGRHPMALQVAAAQLSGRVSISSYVDRIAPDLLRRLEVDGERPFEGAFELAYLALPPDQRHAYRLLGCHPGAEFSLPAAAALLDQPVPDAEELLRALSRAHLVAPVVRARYSIHALLRQHAKAKVSAGDDSRAALRRIVEHYHDFVMARDVVLSKRWRLSTRYEAVIPAHDGERAEDRALAELEEERETLSALVGIAVEVGLDDRAWQLCESLFTYYTDRNYFVDLIEILPVGIAAAERLGDHRALVRMHSHLGSACYAVAEYHAAREHFALSYEIAEVNGDDWGRQSAIEWIGLIHERNAEYDAALDCFERSRAIVERHFQPGRRRRPLALYRMHSGRVLTRAGRAAEAMPRLIEAYETFVELGEVANSAKLALSLAEAQLRGNDLAAASSWGRTALELCRAARMPADEAAALELLAELSARNGDEPTAAQRRREAAEILTVLGNRRAQALLARGS